MLPIKRFDHTDPNFPDCLRHIPDPPREIYVLGKLAPLLARPRLAIVGTRKVTPYGRLVTNRFADEATIRGITVVSGLALGVDAIAHQAALAANGQAVAVLASGLDQITPATNYRLGQQLLARGGAIISEYPPGTPIHKTNFIARNRLVSGLSDAVLVTEAALKSGTWHTANFALDQGKTVLAVPGNITAPMSEGTNNLIKTGALPATDIKDILLALGLPEKPQQIELLPRDPAEAAVMTALRAGHTAVPDLLAHSQLPVPVFNQVLTMLEITGKIYSLGSGLWAIK
jgi:DNA processing protein